jgi:membrane protease YdiL (CAAX protease family)
MVHSSSRSRRFFRLFVVRLLAQGVLTSMGVALLMLWHYHYRRHDIPIPYSLVADLVVTIALAAAVVAWYALTIRWLEHRPATEAVPDWRLCGLGALIGFGLFCSIYGIFALLGVASWHEVNGYGAVIPALIVSLMAGVGEELLFRGVLFRIFEDGFGTTVAMITTAALFGLSHAGNPGATPLSTIAIALEAGLLLAAGYAWSRNLWFVFGLHFSWNFTEGGIFGAPVSGGAMKGILSMPLSASAPDSVTGGAFGPEASVVAVAVCLGMTLVFAIAAIRARRWRALSFRLVLD